MLTTKRFYFRNNRDPYLTLQLLGTAHTIIISVPWCPGDDQNTASVFLPTQCIIGWDDRHKTSINFMGFGNFRIFDRPRIDLSKLRWWQGLGLWEMWTGWYGLQHAQYQDNVFEKKPYASLAHGDAPFFRFTTHYCRVTVLIYTGATTDRFVLWFNIACCRNPDCRLHINSYLFFTPIYTNTLRGFLNHGLEPSLRLCSNTYFVIFLYYSYFPKLQFRTFFEE